MKIFTERFVSNPLIVPSLHESIRNNINGPSLIKAPTWLKDRLGAYYLYFADHAGKTIKLAYADQIEGPYRLYEPGTLSIENTPCIGHIASPDVHVDEVGKRIVMYYHGSVPEKVQMQYERSFKRDNRQLSYVAFSHDGISFESDSEVLTPSYLRVFQMKGMHYGLCMPGLFFRSKDGRTNFQQGPALFTEHMRHAAVFPLQDRLLVFYSNAYDCPEHILMSVVQTSVPFDQWHVSQTMSVLTPTYEYEGIRFPLKASQRGSANQPVRELRDPYVYVEEDRLVLLYTVQGEFGIAGAWLHIEDE